MILNTMKLLGCYKVQKISLVILMKQQVMKYPQRSMDILYVILYVLKILETNTVKYLKMLCQIKLIANKLWLII